MKTNEEQTIRKILMYILKALAYLTLILGLGGCTIFLFYQVSII